MDKAKSITKSGWHPRGKDGGKESWRGEFKGINQVAGWVGKGKNPASNPAALEHSSRPLGSLKDPASFGPPPKNVNYHGDAAVTSPVTPDRRGVDLPLAAQNIQAKQTEETMGKKPAPPVIPYRIDRTGINTSNLPKPPTIAYGVDSDGGGGSPMTKSKPKLPPRLPPRQNSHPGINAPSPPPTYTTATQETPDGSVNQGAISRLGSAGVKVPGFGIGRTSSPQQQGQESNPWRDEQSTTATATSPLGGLQSRFSSLATQSASANAPSPSSAPPPAQGTTWQEKQAALKTASSFRNDPSSISIADAKSTANTANNFRERHGEQIAQGWKVGNGMNKKYGIADKMNNYSGNTVSTSNAGATSMQTATAPSTPASGGTGAFGQAATSALGGFKKAPPPPPATRRITGGAASPPPVPLSSKPR